MKVFYGSAKRIVRIKRRFLRFWENVKFSYVYQNLKPVTVRKKTVYAQSRAAENKERKSLAVALAFMGERN